jgi:hypothetical protein
MHRLARSSRFAPLAGCPFPPDPAATEAGTTWRARHVPRSPVIPGDGLVGPERTP